MAAVCKKFDKALRKLDVLKQEFEVRCVVFSACAGLQVLSGQQKLGEEDPVAPAEQKGLQLCRLWRMENYCHKEAVCRMHMAVAEITARFLEKSSCCRSPQEAAVRDSGKQMLLCECDLWDCDSKHYTTVDAAPGAEF